MERARIDEQVEAGEGDDRRHDGARRDLRGAANGEIRNRDDERECVAGRHRFLKQEIEDQIGAERDGEGRQRRPGASSHIRETDGGEREDDDGHGDQTPGGDERRLKRAHQLSYRGRRPQHHDAAEIFSALIENHA